MLSNKACAIIQRLNDAGFEAYAVGGCVRDMLMRRQAQDVDITTNATPPQTTAAFADCRVIPTGLQHGTVTVLWDGEPFEITTYRTDGAYSDARHPDCVAFSSSLTDDLARRDFTVNAMAYHPRNGLVDPYGGEQDLQNGVLRCVGDPFCRFQEDALRIARLMRFAAVLGFAVDPMTERAAHTLCARLDLVAAERKRVELLKALCGSAFLDAARRFADVLCRIVPVLEPTRGFAQHNPHHEFDVFEHSVRAAALTPNEPIVRLAALFHDIGKPLTFSLDENGVGHFFGHPAESEKLTEQAMRALHFDNATIGAVLPLVRRHDLDLQPTKPCVRRWLSRLGAENFERLLQLRAANVSAQREGNAAPDLRAIRALAEEITQQADCLTLSQLAINGNDLMAAGFSSGPLLGSILKGLLEAVIAEDCPNEKAALLRLAKERWS